MPYNCGHGSEIIPAFFRIDRGTTELPIRQIDAETLGRLEHDGKIVIANLMTQSPGARMNKHGRLILLKPHNGGGFSITDFLYKPHFEKMITGAQGARLFKPAPLWGQT